MTTLGARLRNLEDFESILKDVALELLAEAITPAQILSPVQPLHLLCGDYN